MKMKIKKQFLVDDNGLRQAVVIDLAKYRELMEDIADLKVLAERKDNTKLSYAHFALRLKKHGIL